MEKGIQRDRGRGCPPGPEGKRVFNELGELTFLLKSKTLFVELPC